MGVTTVWRKHLWLVVAWREHDSTLSGLKVVHAIFESVSHHKSYIGVQNVPSYGFTCAVHKLLVDWPQLPVKCKWQIVKSACEDKTQVVPAWIGVQIYPWYGFTCADCSHVQIVHMCRLFTCAVHRVIFLHRLLVPVKWKTRVPNWLLGRVHSWSFHCTVSYITNHHHHL